MTGTKDELRTRLDEARADREETDDDGSSEQSLPGEPIDGPTRDELRDQLRELGLPVTGTKDELQARLDQAAAGDGDDEEDATESRVDRVRRKVAEKLAPSDDDAAPDDGDASGDATDDEQQHEGAPRLRDRFADRLDDVADRLRASGSGDGEDGEEAEDGGDGDGGGPSVPAKLKLAGRVVKDKVTRR